MELSVTTFFLLPVSLSLGMVFGFWVYYTKRKAGVENHAGEGRIYRCGHCQHVYVTRRRYPVLECPRCHHPNPAIRR